ncbi:hypothetical protein K402DRAFT_336476 [Aulographum hederae CBS 113979]|uniref:PCI domain-containing protein n=1 Tax=Aulographum hederae CBS 113979 TaxID=1176131 RepID=A0A6G1GUB4_9PEZI|nr:hypothetical protein K402DRAFT_336476 [Aulographum hederae CBS 113979]
MAEAELQQLIKRLHSTLKTNSSTNDSMRLLSRAKVCLLRLNALVPTPDTPETFLKLARETLELGALIQIRIGGGAAFTTYFEQLQPFYALPPQILPRENSNMSKITGLCLLVKLTGEDYSGFHTLLESLEVAAAQARERGEGGKGLEDDPYIQYAIRVEQAMMEGSYDRVWGETKSSKLPSEEFAIFSQLLQQTIRKEIGDCSEKSYQSIPISNAKNLFFLESEGEVVEYAKSRGWILNSKDGRIYFPNYEGENADDFAERDLVMASGQVIENTLGYARELETIV